MNRARALSAVCLAVAVAAAFPSSGCRPKEQPPQGGGEMVRLNDVSEIENYREILRKDPSNLQALVGIGNLYFDNHQDRLAIENYQKALALDPSNNNVRTDMAICFRRTGNPDRAVEELRKAISLDPRHAQARYNLGIILLHDKGDADGAVKAWEALLANVPDYPYRDSLRAEVERVKGMHGGGQGAPGGAPAPAGIKFGQ